MLATIAAGAASALLGGGKSSTDMARSEMNWNQSPFTDNSNNMTSYVLIGVVIFLIIIITKGKK